MARLIDANKLHYITMLVQNPHDGKHKHLVAVRASEINKAKTVQIDDMSNEIKAMDTFDKTPEDVKEACLSIIQKYL